MKRKILLLFALLSWMMAAGAQDENESYVMNVNLTDGTQIQFTLAEQEPYVWCIDGKMTIYYGEYPELPDFTDDLSTLPQRDNLVFEREQVKNLTFGKVSNSIEQPANSNRISFDLSHTGTVYVSGLQAGDRVQAYQPDGKKVAAVVNRKGTEATIDLSNKPSGPYVISINNRFTYKLMKP